MQVDLCKKRDDENMSTFIVRKLLATYVAAAITSIILASLGTTSKFELEKDFAGLTFFTIYYIGIIVLIYGNLSSSFIEYIHYKWFKKSTWLYIVLHGIFAAALGFVFNSWDLWQFTLIGVVVAIFYACIDRWVDKDIENENKVAIILLTPFLLFGLFWGYFKVSSPPYKPEHAIEQTLNGFFTEESRIFPEKIGRWEGKIDRFNVVRETAVEEIEKNTYIVTFTETWADENSSGSWFKSFQASPSGTSSYDNGGFSPLIKDELQ